MVTDSTMLAVYAALAENVYRRDHNLDQALNISDIGALVTGGIQVVNPSVNTIPVTD